MSTGREIIQDALLDIGVGALGEDLEESIMNRSLRIWNRMISSWSAELGPIYSSTLDELTWTSGSDSMTIGTGGDLNTIRPIQITGVQVTVSGVDYTLLPVSFEQYQMTPIKDIASNYPMVYSYQREYPLGKIFLYYVPESNIPIRIQSKKALTEVDLDSTLALPEGYELAIQSNLTVLLAPAHGKVASPTVMRTAFRSMQAIEGINEDDTEMSPDLNCPGISDNYCDDLGALTNG